MVKPDANIRILFSLDRYYHRNSGDPKGIYGFWNTEVSFNKRLLTAFFYIADVVFFVLLGLKLLDILSTEMIDPIWLLLIFAFVSLAGQIIRWFVEHYLLGRPMPKPKDTVS